jgi:hypothetical protein
VEKFSVKISQVQAHRPQTNAFFHQEDVFPFKSLLQADPYGVHVARLGQSYETRCSTDTTSSDAGIRLLNR